ncbi:hypothetical protein OU800_05265 [Pseudomonas sp. GOM7]|uniref:hypothetical protein n=1 Tax=Pseudomonas sp. GOM7 TaxID=2998079 RepID=UPI00227C4043|nr:hypothetical protein [Pseudomonas sp. GOM7]WAJ38643.1 hypothetical protein OU800_05265 [Pseudomonas sp. GOM7]
MLTIDALAREANAFAERESIYDEPLLFGITDGKAIGTYIEHKFTSYLAEHYDYEMGNSASGIDIPGLNVDIKVTSVRQPQSSCPFRSASQKIYGLGYHLLIFVYAKCDDHLNKTARLDMQHVVFVEQSRTADYQTTRGLLNILERGGNEDDIVAFIFERNLPVEEIEAYRLAEQIMREPPAEGSLTISNAMQWRLQYGRVIQQAGAVDGVWRVR